MKKILRKCRVVDIDVYIYKMSDHGACDLPEFKYVILTENLKSKTRYYIKDVEVLVHESFLYPKVFLLKTLGKKGPVIGDCFTHKKYRGQAIYPYVLNYIANIVLETNEKEVYVVVNTTNSNSIKGIEKAGFSKFASIKAKRWLWFYIKRQIEYYN